MSEVAQIDFTVARIVTAQAAEVETARQWLAGTRIAFVRLVGSFAAYTHTVSPNLITATALTKLAAGSSIAACLSALSAVGYAVNRGQHNQSLLENAMDDYRQIIDAVDRAIPTQRATGPTAFGHSEIIGESFDTGDSSDAAARTTGSWGARIPVRALAGIQESPGFALPTSDESSYASRTSVTAIGQEQILGLGSPARLLTSVAARSRSVPDSAQDLTSRADTPATDRFGGQPLYQDVLGQDAYVASAGAKSGAAPGADALVAAGFTVSAGQPSDLASAQRMGFE